MLTRVRGYWRWCTLLAPTSRSIWLGYDQAYLVPDGTSQVFDVTGGVLTVTGDQILLPTNDNITVDTSAWARPPRKT